MDKTAQSGTISSVVMLIVGVAVAVLVLIFVGTLGGQSYEIQEDNLDAIGNKVVANTTFTALNGTAVYLGHGDIHSGTLIILNGSAGVALANFSIDYTAGYATLITGVAFNNTALKASYTWGNITVGNSVKAAVVSGFESLEQTGDYLPIIVLAVVISLVLILVLGFTRFGMGSGKGGAL